MTKRRERIVGEICFGPEKRGAHATLSRATWQEIRVGMTKLEDHHDPILAT
jgi:hypothetical protein